MIAVAERIETSADVGDGYSGPDWPRRVMVVGTVVFVVLFVWLSLARHARLGTRAFDLAIFDQGLWLMSEGDTPFVTVRGLHLFADHSSFLMVALVPLYWIWADVRVLLILTVLAVAAGGPLVYAAARSEGLAKRPAAVLGIGYLLMPAVQWQAWDAFHPETLAIPLLLGAYLLAMRGRPGWALTLLAVVLLAKEDAALIVIPLAVYLGLRFRSRMLAVGGALLGLAALAIAFGVLLPHWSPTGELIYTDRYSQYGDSLVGVVWGAATSPGEVFGTILSVRGLLYLLGMLLPPVVAIAAPELLLVAAPTLLANLLSAHTYQAVLKYHYTAYIIPVVAIAAIVGSGRLLNRASRRSWAQPATRTRLVLAGVLILSCVAGPWGWGERNPWGGHTSQPELATAALAVIPPEAAVAADSRIVPHLAHRKSIYVLPNPIIARNWSAPGVPGPPAADFDWVAVPSDLEGLDDEYLQLWTALRVDDRFVVVIQNEAVTVLRRADP